MNRSLFSSIGCGITGSNLPFPKYLNIQVFTLKLSVTKRRTSTPQFSKLLMTDLTNKSSCCPVSCFVKKCAAGILKEIYNPDATKQSNLLHNKGFFFARPYLLPC